MTKLEKEAEDYAEQFYGWTNNDYALDVAKATYIASAEPRESRIAELKEQLTKAKEIIKKILYEYQRLCLIKKETIADAEQFLKEIEK